MKNKRLLVILIIFLVIGTLAILGGTVFSIKSITVRFSNVLDYFVDADATKPEKDAITAELEASIEESLGYMKNKNILFNVNSAKITTSVEGHKDNYEGFRLRVSNVKAEFPNKLVITVRERYPVYQYTVGTETVVLDGDLTVLDKKLPKDGRPLVSLMEALPHVDVTYLSDLKIGETLESNHPEREAIIKEVVPFFARISSYEDAVTKFFSKIEFRDDVPGQDPAAITFPLTLVMTQRISTDYKEPPNKNYYELRIIGADHTNIKTKLIKIWQMVESQKNKAGLYEIMDWKGPYEATVDGKKVTKYPKDELLGFYYSAR